ncbi:hypothetical protein FG142_04140 [Vibrio cholerae]|uniref:hypothetical protein n=1 Tax=Vibrio cholerae TaxID=666 RepID=UPI0022F2D378|nr:hypothetical protein [Vibrio cholerae]MDA5313464.1 hypothetical protein [Vibrio cholerae]MDN6969718.1 hypothetical protein [Vibrio cholerae]
MLDIQISAPGCGNTRLLSNDGKVFFAIPIASPIYQITIDNNHYLITKGLLRDIQNPTRIKYGDSLINYIFTSHIAMSLDVVISYIEKNIRLSN